MSANDQSQAQNPQRENQQQAASTSAKIASTVLLAGLSIGLPHGVTFLFPHRTLAQRTSADRPEHPVLTALTAEPTTTMALLVMAVGVSMTFYSRQIQHTLAPSQKYKVSTCLWTRWRWCLSQVVDGLEGAGMGAAAYLFVIVALGSPVGMWVTLQILESLTCSDYSRSLLLALQLSMLTVFPALAIYGIPALDDKGISARYRLTRLFCELE